MCLRYLMPLLLFFLVVAPGCDTTEEPEVEIEDIIVGTGPAAERGDWLTVHYVGSFKNGIKFDSTGSGAPYGFRLGMDDEIEGWHIGLAGMREGGLRRLTIPPELAYGRWGKPDPENPNDFIVPPNAPVVYDIELLDVRDPRTEP